MPTKWLPTAPLKYWAVKSGTNCEPYFLNATEATGHLPDLDALERKADILKRAMIDTHAALLAWNAGRPTPARMILTVHDELLFEVPEAQAEEATALVREHMERAAALDVPLTVDVGVGANWKDAKS